MTAANSTAANILDTAADIVDRGWCQRIAHDGAGNYCAEGAIRSQMAPASAITAAERALVAVLITEYGDTILRGHGGHFLDRSEVITSVNDYYATTGTEISTCMRKAAVNLREQA